MRENKKDIFLNFKLCDIKGLEIDDGMDLVEFCYIFDGYMFDKYLVYIFYKYFLNNL